MGKSIIGIEKLDEICTGCRACENACPTNCISFDYDKEGFIYPKVDSKKCIECQKCINVCHALKTYDARPLSQNNAFYGWTTPETQKESSSGGAFSAIVDLFLKNGGYVVGAAFRENYLGVHHVIKTADNYAPLRKSKYVFSDPENTFLKAKELLDSGNRVLYSGTPCQISGLKSFLGKEYYNLLTVDFICHGVSSERFYNNNISYLAKKNKIISVDFRPNIYSVDPALKVVLGNGKRKKTIYKDQIQDYYLYHYFHNNSLRKPCYSCHYASNNHQSDITLADFWRAKDKDKNLAVHPQISLIICNNTKGIEIIEQVLLKKKERVEEEYYSYVYNNGHDWYSRKERDSFFEVLSTTDISALERNHSRNLLKYSLKQKIKHLLFKVRKG